MLTRPLGRRRNRWEDDIRNDMIKLKIKNWTSCIQDRNKWKYVEKAWVCGRSPAEIVGLNPTGGMNVCCECCVVR
jgi:hypothetical protein